MKIKHLEKITLLIVLSFFTLSFFVSKSTISNKSAPIKSFNYLNSKIISGKKYYSLDRNLNLLPGDNIFITNINNQSIAEYKINQILIPVRSKIEIITKSGSKSGFIRQELVLTSNWHSLPGVIPLKVGTETVNVKISEIIGINGILWLSLNSDIQVLNSSEIQISFYQRTVEDNVSVSTFEKLKWISTPEQNETFYDLFTPPIIYIHNGDLSTRLPEKVEQKQDLEPFGLTLVDVSKAEYPLRLKSWVGDTPYFEDIFGLDFSTGQKGTRNRVEVGKTYKRDLNSKQGQPSLIICDENSSDKLFIVQYFTVQQYRNPDTGGLKPVGRAMVKDFNLGGEPFEINSLMTQVFAGNYTFKFLASLPGIASEEFSFESSHTPPVFEYAGRNYIITNLDLQNRSLNVTKRDPREADDVSQSFSF